MDTYDIENRRKEHLLMQMYMPKDNPEYVECARPNVKLRDHDSTKFKIKTTRNQRVYKSPNYLGVQLWERLTGEIWTIPNSIDFKRNIHGLLLA